MLYMHCGLPRTSTSAFQTALLSNRKRLAVAGIDVPEVRGGRGEFPKMGEELSASLRSGRAFESLRFYLERSPASNVLFSDENLSGWLLRDEHQDVFLRMAAAVLEVTPIRCIWTLRRLDEVANSLRARYCRVTGTRPPPLAERLAAVPRAASLFSGIRRVREALGEEVAFVRYDPAGGHNHELLTTMGVPHELAAAVVRGIECGPRVNRSLSRKEAVVLFNRRLLSGRLGIELELAVLRKLFSDGALTFEGDGPWELTGGQARDVLHREALAAARDERLDAYLRYFRDGEVARDAPVDSLDIAVLTEGDLAQVAQAFAAVTETER